MSYQLPQTGPSLSSSQRPLEDNYWRASSRNSGSGSLGGYGLSQSQSGNSVGGISHKLNSFFDTEKPLPMYKDKPYFAPRRTGPARQRQRIVYGVVGFVVVSLLWLLLGSGGSEQSKTKTGSLKGGDLWSWAQSFEHGEAEKPSGRGNSGIDWDARREKVKDAFMVSWDGYEKYAWGFDEYHPVSKGGKHMINGGMGWIIIDALDTLMIMNLTSRVQDARRWIHTSLQYNQDHDVNTFETTIRMLGGLLSAHYLSTKYPDLAPIRDDDEGSPGEDLYIEKATDLADRLLGAFDSTSGVPYASVNLNTSRGIPSHADGGASSTAEATSVQLEFKYLAKLTGEAEYWKTVEKVMQVVDDQQRKDGLLPIFINPESGEFRGENIRLGSRGDSYYEYLIKQYLQTSEQEPIYKELWDESLMGIRKHLITYTKHAQMTVLGERPNGLDGTLSPKMDHLVCFMPGTIALGATGGRPLAEAKKSPDWTRRQDEEILLAKELMKTCWATYLATKTGLAPEITYFRIDDPPRMMTDVFPSSTMTEGNSKSKHEDLLLVSQPLYPLEDNPWQQDIDIHAQDRHNLQRPETVESLFYMYRITGDETYRHWGWEMFKSFIKHTAVIETEDDPSAKDKKPSSHIMGFTSLSNVNTIPAAQRDNMESFWLAETLKYFYLLFSDRDFISLEENVFNTEAHPMPRFKLGGDLKTGWTRKERN
ncbi:CAZyme family GH47 [Paecilomyces variotii]|nr:CAZyme family GH47 [Paecilomyces variotii]